MRDRTVVLELTREMSAAAATTSAVVLGVADDQLTAPTPCAGFDVRGVVNHLMGVLVVAERAGRRAPQADAATLGRDRVVGDWRGRFATLVRAALDAWPAPAWHGEAELLGRTFPAADAGRKLLGELVVHGWDLARATGQPYEPDDRAVAAVHDYFTRSFAAGRNPGAWSPEHPVAADAPAIHQVVALSGRNPTWPA